MTQSLSQADAFTQLEWQGKFSASVSARAQFALYLAMQTACASDNVHINPNETRLTTDNYPDRLNHYRRPEIYSESYDFNWLKYKSEFLHSSVNQVRLLDALHPSPLCLKKSTSRIPTEIIENTPIRARRKLAEQETVVIDEDNTLLADVIDRVNEWQKTTLA